MLIRKVIHIVLSVICLVSSFQIMADNIKAEGNIVNAVTGEPVTSVSLVITVARFNLFADFFRSSKTERRTVDGNYQVGCYWCSSLRVLFFAEGYHSETRVFGEQNFSSSNIIKMQPVMDAVTLVHYRGRLVVHQKEDENRILPLGSKSRLSSSLEKARQRSVKQGNDLLYIQLLTKLDKSGEPQMLMRNSLQDPRLAVSAIIDFSNAKGGVVPYTSTYVSPRDIRRSMFLAPEEGYQPKLELDTSAEGPIWFYVHIDGNYGRGRAFPPSLEDTGSGRRLVVSVELFLNPDGSRNLETVE